MEYKMMMVGYLESQSNQLLRLLRTIKFVCSACKNMDTLVLLALNLVCALAAPSPYVNVSPQITSTADIQIARTNNVPILSQINDINEDGSYTFGYESADGSFRIESRDVDGFVSGKYGYVDVNGEVQEFEYVAGSIAGRSLGYQARGSAIPVGTRGHTAQTFPVLSGPVSLAQKAVDYEYLSVDDDADGFPDRLTNQGQNVVRLTSQAQTTLNRPSSSILRVVSPAPAVVTEPTVVRLPVNTGTTSNIVRVVNPAAVSNTQQTIVRLPIQGEPQPNIVRVNSGQVATHQKQSNIVRVVNPVSNQQQSTSTRFEVPTSTQASIVRVVNPVTQPTAVRVAPQKNTKISSVVQPARLSSSGYQVITPNRQRQSQLIQQVVRSPYYSSYGGQQFVTRNPVYSSSQFNPFLSGIRTSGGSSRDSFGRLTGKGSHQLTNFSPSFQTIVVDDDDFDFDDLNDFDDDDTFVVNSSPLIQ